jgi:hypothetical protein
MESSRSNLGMTSLPPTGGALKLAVQATATQSAVSCAVRSSHPGAGLYQHAGDDKDKDPNKGNLGQMLKIVGSTQKPFRKIDTKLKFAG